MKYLLNGVETDRTLQDLFENEDLKDIELLVGDDIYKVGVYGDFDEFITDKYLELWGWVSEDICDDEIRLYVDLEETYKHLDDTGCKSILECDKNAQVTIFTLDIDEPFYFYRSEYEDLDDFTYDEMLEVLIECKDIYDELSDDEDYLNLTDDLARIKYIEKNY